MVKHFLAGGTGVKNSTRGVQVENFVVESRRLTHRRDAESAEEAQRVEFFSLRYLRVLCVSAVS